MAREDSPTIRACERGDGLRRYDMPRTIEDCSALKDLYMILHIIPYSTVGIALGYAYKEHNNIIGTMTLHAFHNIIAVIEILIII